MPLPTRGCAAGSATRVTGTSTSPSIATLDAVAVEVGGVAEHVDVGVHGQEHAADRGVVARVHDDGLRGQVLEVRAPADPHGTMVAGASPETPTAASEGGR